MAVAKGNTSSGQGNTDTLTWSHVAGGGADCVLMVGVSIDSDTVNVDTITFNTSESFTQLRNDVNAGANSSEIWYLLNPTDTTANIVVTLDGKAQVIGGAVDFNGASTPDNPDGATPDSVTSSSITVAGDTADNFMFDVIAKPGGTATEGADQVADWNLSQGGNQGAGSSQDGTSGGVMSWTSASDDWAHTACRIPEAVADDNSSSSSVSSVSSASSQSSSSSQDSFIFDQRRMRMRVLKTL